PNADTSSGRVEADQTRLFSTDSLEDAMENFEAEFIRRKMSQHDNIIHDTARSIGVAPAYIEDKLNEK
ncbi:sigma-54-dependent Fis family transcriptional regulator, partial [Desulfobacterales bacterium HSG16]|nr:sigma-54-dependent Fis family transcriptional regulator [Desulfobacterales bacterium HSG16]